MIFYEHSLYINLSLQYAWFAHCSFFSISRTIGTVCSSPNNITLLPWARAPRLEGFLASGTDPRAIRFWGKKVVAVHHVVQTYLGSTTPKAKHINSLCPKMACLGPPFLHDPVRIAALSLSLALAGERKYRPNSSFNEHSQKARVVASTGLSLAIYATIRPASAVFHSWRLCGSRAVELGLGSVSISIPFPMQNRGPLSPRQSSA